MRVGWNGCKMGGFGWFVFLGIWRWFWGFKGFGWSWLAFCEIEGFLVGRWVWKWVVDGRLTVRQLHTEIRAHRQVG